MGSLFLSLLLASPAWERITTDPFSGTVYLAQTSEQPLSTSLTVRQRNDGNLSLRAVGPCFGRPVVERRNGTVHVTCEPGVAVAFTAFIREWAPTHPGTPAEAALAAADQLAANGDFTAAASAYVALMRRGFAKTARRAEMGAATVCWRTKTPCPDLDEFASENSSDRQRLTLLRLVQLRPLDALPLLKRMHTLGAMMLRDHAIGVALRELYLAGDDLSVAAFFYHHEAEITAHGDARELRAFIASSLYELEADEELRAFTAGTSDAKPVRHE